MKPHFHCVLALNSWRFSASEMALAYLGMHDFAGSGNVKTALGRFMCPNLGH